MKLKDRKKHDGRYGYLMPAFYTDERQSSMVDMFMNNYNMTYAQALRHIFENGINYMAMYGDGVGKEADSRAGRKIQG